MTKSSFRAPQALDAFARDFAKWPKAVSKLTSDREALLPFYDFPAEHWIHLRTSNPIESTFSPVRARTDVDQGAGLAGGGARHVLQADRGGRREVEEGQRAGARGACSRWREVRERTVGRADRSGGRRVSITRFRSTTLDHSSIRQGGGVFTELVLRNFKCYRDTGPVRLKPLTLLIGPNNVGKSTLLQAILMMKQTYEDRDVGEPLITSGPYVDLGAFQDILRGGRQASRRILYISLRMSSSDTRRMVMPENLSNLSIPIADRISVRFSFNARRNAVVVSGAELRNDQGVFLSAKRTGEGLVADHLPAYVRRNTQIGLVNFLPSIQPAGKPPRSELKGTETCNGISDQASRSITLP